MPGRGRLAAAILLNLVVEPVANWWLDKEGKGRFAVVMLWSLAVVPITVPFASRNQSGRWALAFLVLAGASLVLAVAIGGSWDDSGLRTAIPGLTAAALLLTAPWLAPWTLHDLAGHPVPARIAEAEPVLDLEEEDTWRTRYRLTDPATGRDLGSLAYGPRARTPVGTVVTVSLVPDGWAPPIAAERLDDTDVPPGITAFAALAAVHVLACAATAAAWPREW
ncbi:hypothetical protein [Streptomyces sp. NPDC058751]|uniref:hypothetical protein n=1 Tax=Streptomyces sp. NPDC058751 TaxID=3346623 RepID=UPI00367A9B2A